MANDPISFNSPNEPMIIFCSCGCGKSVKVRPRKVQHADFYVAKTDCASKLPPCPHGHTKRIVFNSAGGFTGITYAAPMAQITAVASRSNGHLDFSTVPEANAVALGSGDEDQRSLAEWFDLSKRIPRDDVDLFIQDVTFRAAKEGYPKNELRSCIGKMRGLVRAHNEMFPK